MTTEWKQMGPNQFAIEMHPPLGARLFVGIAVSAFAAFFLYNLPTGLYEYVLNATIQEWLWAIPGFLINLILILIFAVPALIIFFKSVRVEVDQDSEKIRDVSDHRLFCRSKDFPLDSLDIVQTRYYVSTGRGDKTIYPYRVQLVFKDWKIITASVEATEEDARRLAERLAKSSALTLSKLQKKGRLL